MSVSVGHCHPVVNHAIAQQMEHLQHTTTIYLSPQIAQYAAELAERMPGNLKVRSPVVCKRAAAQMCACCTCNIHL